MAIKTARRWFTTAVLLLGATTFAFLLHSFGPARIWARVSDFGWGFALLLPFQLLDHFINALGWRYAFAPEEAAKTSLRELIRVRVAGDGVNYLTPSGNLAGEFVRPGMLRAPLSHDAKVASVVAAKATQAAGQALFVMAGLAWILTTRLYDLGARQAVMAAGSMILVLLGVAVGLWAFAHEPPAWLERRFPALAAAAVEPRRLLRRTLSGHPWRLAASTAFFMLGYAWGALEIALILALMGEPQALTVCLSIEFLSNLVDSLAFMVPAKIGTQEAGKAAIFKALALSPESGFALGVIRHVREVCWAALGFGLYARHARALKG